MSQELFRTWFAVIMDTSQTIDRLLFWMDSWEKGLNKKKKNRWKSILNGAVRHVFSYCRQGNPEISKKKKKIFEKSVPLKVQSEQIGAFKSKKKNTRIFRRLKLRCTFGLTDTSFAIFAP